jgi:hypothetical protein
MRLAIEVSRSAVVPEREVSLTDLHRILAHLDLVDIAGIGGSEIGELDLRRFQLALRKREGDVIGLRIDVEERIANLDLLPLDNMHGGD